VIDALGFGLQAPEPAPAPQAATLAALSSEQRQLILDELSAGRLTSAEALALLQGQDIPAQGREEDAAGTAGSR
jgi:hypothetical protein